MSWVSCKLGDIINLKRGYDLPKAKRIAGEIPVVSSSGRSGSHNKAKVGFPAVVTGRYGTLGKVYYIDKDCWPLNTALYVQNFKGNRPKFIYYFLQSVLKGMQSDKAAVPGVNRNDLHARSIIYPEDEKQQERIENLLAPYDDLIENNRRRIQLLEESARLLYREWFVLLRFPGHEHTKIIAGIPEGWEKKTLGEVTSCLKRGITPKYADDGEYRVINQKCIRNRLLTLSLARKQTKKYNMEKAVFEGDVLVNSTGTGTLGRVAQCWKETRKTTVDTHVTIVRPLEEIPSWWFGYAVMEFESLFEGMGEGATNQKELKRTYMAEVSILLATKSLMETFHKIVAYNIQQIVNLSEQNQKLAQARDLLLPRLVNGEIDA